MPVLVAPPDASCEDQGTKSARLMTYDGRVPDWSKLPGNFGYLVGPAERYGGIASWDGPLRRRVKRSEVDELSKLARKIGWNNHEVLLHSWMCANADTCAAELIEGLLNLMERFDLDVSDYGPKQEPQWTIELWDNVYYRVLYCILEQTREVLPDDEAISLVFKALERVPKDELAITAFMLLHPFRTCEVLDWTETHADEALPSCDWGFLAAVSEFSWSRATLWLRRGRPLSLIALDALVSMNGKSDSPIVRKARPRLLGAVPREEAKQVLLNYRSADPDPRVRTAVATILKSWRRITGEPRRI
jgi:hypothetical protein